MTEYRNGRIDLVQEKETNLKTNMSIYSKTENRAVLENIWVQTRGEGQKQHGGRQHASLPTDWATSTV